MKILVLNCGSSSLKYQLIDMTDESVIAKGYFERIGSSEAFLTHKVGEQKYRIEKGVSNHEDAIQIVIDELTSADHGVISNMNEISAVGHRAVHGGEKFNTSVIIDNEVMEKIKDCIEIAPLHTPAIIAGIEACKKIMPDKKMVAVFDTAFHQTLEKEKYIYPIPYEYYEKYRIRKYGFHGTSHKYVANRVAELMGKTDLKVINCHLGQGASICAIKSGISVDTSMGFTPISGIPMGSRCGDIDPAILPYLMRKESITAAEAESILNKKSGVLGISGISADFRDIEDVQDTNERAKLSLDIYSYIVAQYIAKYMVTLEGADVITFTAGVGENGASTRSDICKRLEFMGVKIDEEKNNVRGVEREISTPDSKIKVYIVPTNEELMIARDTESLI